MKSPTPNGMGAIAPPDGVTVKPSNASGGITESRRASPGARVGRKYKYPYWYRQYVGGCPVCGRDAGYKERVNGRKPKDLKKVYIPLPDQETYDNCMG